MDFSLKKKQQNKTVTNPMSAIHYRENITLILLDTFETDLLV